MTFDISAISDLRLTTISLSHSTTGLAPLIAQLNDICDKAGNLPLDAIITLVIANQSGPDSSAFRYVELELLSKWERALSRLEGCPRPLLAVVEGHCLGPMLEVLLTTDYRIASEKALFGLAQCDGKVWPSTAIRRLALQLDNVTARQLVLFGSHLDAIKALSAGLITSVSRDLRASIAEACATMPKTGLQDLAIRRRLLLEASGVSHEEALGAHLAACERTARG